MRVARDDLHVVLGGTEMSEPVEEKRCYVSMPFGVKRDPDSGLTIDFDTIYQLIIKPAAMDAGYSTVRADELMSFVSISPQLIETIASAELLIADLTNGHPHVLYEVGLRDAWQKPALLVLRSGQRNPLDGSIYRVFQYSDAPESVMASRRAIYDQITALERGGPHAGSPVAALTAAKKLVDRGKEDGPASRSAFDTAFMDLLSGITARLDNIDAKVSTAPASPESKPGPMRWKEGHKPRSRRIFIVHGRGEVASSLRNQLVTFLERLQFEPIVLSEQAEGGRALPTKLEEEMSDVEFAFVLLTPDDLGAHKSEIQSLQSLRPRARQNVIYEHGVFVGRLGLSRICVVQTGSLEIPSDLSGIVPKTLNESEEFRRIRLELITELRNANYDVDANLLL